uniref:Uncharacterized protein n=1 Tax=Oryza punctata TaxID=4537 RepID=A0A0E0LIS0_ORYPU
MAIARVNLAILSLSLIALLVLAAVPEAAGGRSGGYVDYGAMNKDHIPGTPQLNHQGGPANQYTRGCEKQLHCRGRRRGF